MLTAVLLFFRLFTSSSSRRRRANAVQPLQELVAQLTYESSRSGTLKGKGWGLAELEIGSTRRRRELSHADIVNNLRWSLRALTGRWPFVVVAIDELDKLPSRDAAIRAVNTLKDLRHIEGVHLIVTVSDEARASFELFGAERDAFDSTFDAIIQVDRLDIGTARHLIDARVVGFPTELVALSYIGSAGLARDLIRRARQYFEAAAAHDSVPAWRTLALECLRGEAESMLIAYSELHRTEESVSSIGSLFSPIYSPDALEPPALAANIESLSPDLTRIYARIAILRMAIDWIAGVNVDDSVAAATMDRMRDATLLATRDGQPGIAIALAMAAVATDEMATNDQRPDAEFVA